MSNWRGVVLFIVAGFLFLIANRGAYRGFFMDDDLDNISWTSAAAPQDFAEGFFNPRYYPNHFRPIGHFAYHVLATTAGLNYRWYVVLIQCLHFANTALLWWLLRRLDLPPLASAAGALFFLFHMGLFDALWKPMYQFDVWCGLFSLLSLHCWISRRWVLSFAFFWAAYKAKEHAVMLPAAFALYEWWLGEKRWRPLIPFVLASASFGVQAALTNRTTSGDYELKLSTLGLIRTIVFYGTRVLVHPYLGFVLLLLPRRVPDRRLWFGLAFGALLLAPMLALPARLSGAYLYVSMLGVAIAAGVLAARVHWGFVALFFALWLPLNFESMREQRKGALAYANDNRTYVDTLAGLPKRHGDIRRFVYDGRPPGMHPWGIRSALQLLYRTRDIEIYPVEEKNLQEVFSSGGVALLSWDGARRQLSTIARSAGTSDEPYMRMTPSMPFWQLEEGWYGLEGRYRWTKPIARARLYRPAEARLFEVNILVGPQYIAAVRRGRLEILIDGQPIGATEYADHGWRTVRLDLAPAPAATVKVEFRASPPFQTGPSDRVLGIAMGGFGFLSANAPPGETP